MPESQLPEVPGRIASAVDRKRERDVLGIPYFHVVFYRPARAQFTRAEQPTVVLQSSIYSARSQTALEIAADPKILAAEIGILSALHTWGQNLLIHPHIHCVIPQGGIAPDQRAGFVRAISFFCQ